MTSARIDPRPYPWPSANKSRLFLAALLAGKTVDIAYSFRMWNLMTPNARAAELRKLGWPVQSIRAKHPNVAGEFYVVYKFDAAFVAWWHNAFANDPDNAHPLDWKDATTQKFSSEGETNAASTS